nr:thiol:disulfide interchange protein DsbA/DsbL [uncultured Pseudomonas sp.]
MRNLILSATLVASSLFGMAVQAEPIEAGKQYVELSTPVPVSQPGKIEVVELFWFGCGHCYRFEPTINPWIKQLPDDVHFTRIPAMFGGAWNIHGQMYFTLQALDAEQRVHSDVFDAIHQQHKKLSTPEEMADFFATKGIDRETFLKTFNSFGVKSQMEKAKKLAMAYQISGVPTMIVNGKYRFDISSSGGPQKTLEVANYLIEKERAAQ